MGLGICVHDAHFVNTVSPILPEVIDQEVTLIFCGLYWWRGGWDCCGFGTGRLCLWPLHGTTVPDNAPSVEATEQKVDLLIYDLW